MLIFFIWFIVITFVMNIILLFLVKNTILVGVITFVVMTGGYMIIVYVRSTIRINLIEEKCDAQAFIEATEKQRKITGKKPKINTILNIDRAAGLMALGELKKAKELLLSIDKSLLSSRNGTLCVYTINLISCLYGLGEFSSAEEIFETQIPLVSPIGPRMTQSMKFLIAERFFYLGRLEESKAVLQSLLKEKTSLRTKMEILYVLAQIDEISGDTASAKKKYREVSVDGYTLSLALDARKRLANM